VLDTSRAKVKAIPLQSWTDPQGSRRLKLPEFLDRRHREVKRLLALHTGRLYPREILLAISCYRLSRTQGGSAAGRIISMKNSSDTNRNRTRYLPACIAVPQPTAPPRAHERVLGFIPNRGENGGCVRMENISKNIRPSSGHRYLCPPQWRCIGSLDILGYEETKSPNALKRRLCSKVCWTWAVLGGVSRRNIKNEIKCWVGNQHLAMWRGPGSTQRQPRKLISGTIPTTKSRLQSFNMTQSRGVTGLLTGHNTPRRHLYLMWNNNLTCKKCSTEK
jgi:hypothetical protein